MTCPHCGAEFTPEVHTREASAEFDAFWAAYPKKAAKKDAEKAWRQTLTVRPNLPDLLRALETAKQTDAWRKERGSYVPYAASWLRGERWMDQRAPEATPAGLVPQELWRRLSLLLAPGDDLPSLKRWVSAAWQGLDLVLSPQWGPTRTALVGRLPEIQRLARDYDVMVRIAESWEGSECRR